MRKGLRTVSYPAAELGASKEWYTKLFGTPPYFDEPFYVGFDIGGYELGLVPDDEEPCAFWAVPDVAVALERAGELGATRVQEPTEVGGGIVVAKVRSPEGHVIGFIDNPHFAPAATVSGPTEHAIVREARVDLPPREAWEAWASSEGVARWWTEHSRIEARPGGHYELYFLMEARPGDRGGEGCRVLSLLPGRMLSFTWNAPPHLRTRDEHTWVVLELEAEGQGTRVTLTHLGWPEAGMADEASDWPATFAYFEQAWSRVMERFAAAF